MDFTWIPVLSIDFCELQKENQLKVDGFQLKPLHKLIILSPPDLVLKTMASSWAY